MDSNHCTTVRAWHYWRHVI